MAAGWQQQCSFSEPQLFGTKRLRGTMQGPSPQPLCPSNPRVKPSLPKQHNADHQIPQATAPLWLFTINNTPNRLTPVHETQVEQNQRRKDKTSPTICLLPGISNLSWERKTQEKYKKQKPVYQIYAFILVWTEIKAFCCFSSHSDFNWPCEVWLTYAFKVFISPVHFSECYVRMRTAVLIKCCLCLAFENAGFSLYTSLKIVQKQNVLWVTEKELHKLSWFTDVSCMLKSSSRVHCRWPLLISW